MISTTYSGTPVWLCNHEPNWARPVDASFSVLARTVAGKSNREQRESMAPTLRATLSYGALLDAAQSTAMRSMVSLYANEPVLAPFWPAATAHTGGAAASITGALKVWWEPNWTAWELGTGIAPGGFTPSADCMVAPVLWGRLGALPVSTSVNGSGDTEVRFEFIENGTAALALTPAAQTFTTTVINGQTVPVLTVLPDWGNNSATPDIRLSRQQIGFGRADAAEFVPQQPRQKYSFSYDLLDTAETRYLLALFADRRGSVHPWRTYAVFSASLGSSLARFGSDTLKLSWSSWAYGGERVAAKVEVVTLPAEANAITGETPGTNHGGVPARWFGYLVTDGINSWRYTSHESDIAGPGGTFTAAKISHEQITEEINLAVSECRLLVQPVAGGPWQRLRSQQAAPQLTVTIYEGPLATPLTAAPIYTGTATQPEVEATRWQIKLVGLGSLLELQGPRTVLSEICLASFGDSLCKLSLTGLQVTKTLLSVSGDKATFQTAGGLATGRFANGEARRVVGGITQRYLIVDSKTVGADLECVIAGTISPAPTGSEAGWVLVPGCNGRFTTCTAFGNAANFRGFPNVPRANPAMIPIKQGAQGGKKG